MNLRFRENRLLTSLILAVYLLSGAVATFSHQHGIDQCGAGTQCASHGSGLHGLAGHAHVDCADIHSDPSLAEADTRGCAAHSCSQHCRQPLRQSVSTGPKKPARNASIRNASIRDNGARGKSFHTFCAACELLAQKAVSVTWSVILSSTELRTIRSIVSERIDVARVPLSFTARGPPEIV